MIGLSATLALAVLAGGAFVALWDRASDGAGTLVDDERGAYRGVRIGDGVDEVANALGEPERSPGFAPAGESPADAGVPQTLPGPGTVLKYEDVSLLAGQQGVYALMVTERGARTKRGVAIGDSMADARRAYELKCIDVAGGESLLGEQEFSPSCRASVGRLRIWFGRDPIRSITLLSPAHSG